MKPTKFEMIVARTARPSPPGWTQPEGLTGRAILDPDVAAGLEFLAQLDKRLDRLEKQIKALGQFIEKAERLALLGREETNFRLAAIELTLKK